MNKKERKGRSRSLAMGILWTVMGCALVIVAVFVAMTVYLILEDRFTTEIAEVEIMGTGMSIVGLAVTVWLGLNIANIVERREVDDLKQEIRELTETREQWVEDQEQLQQRQELLRRESEAYREQLARADYANFLGKLAISGYDGGSAGLLRLIRAQENICHSGMPYAQLSEIEQFFQMVYQGYRTGASAEEQESLIREGLDRLEHLEHPEQEPRWLGTYLDDRRGEFCYYMGYSLQARGRLSEGMDAFRQAIEQFGKCAPVFGVPLPRKDLRELSDPPGVYPTMTPEQIETSAYFYNTIGDSYSKIAEAICHQKAENSGEALEQYGAWAEYLCHWAANLSKREVYMRDYGVAVERRYGVVGGDLSHLPRIYDRLKEIYRDTLERECTRKGFKVLLSLMDKRVNQLLGIGHIRPGANRVPDLGAPAFRNHPRAAEAKEILEELLPLANQAREIFPDCEHGYLYLGLYYRDRCALEQEPALRREFYEKALEAWRYLGVLKPGAAMTRILRKDLEDLEKTL